MKNSLYKGFYRLAKVRIEYNESIIVGFFIPQCAKLQMLELYYNFFTNFSEVNKFTMFEMDTDSLFVTLDDKELENCIRSEVIAKCERFLSKNCSDSSTANASGNFIPEMCFDKHKNNEKKEPGPFKGELRCTEMLYVCSKTYCFYAVASNNF